MLAVLAVLAAPAGEWVGSYQMRQMGQNSYGMGWLSHYCKACPDTPDPASVCGDDNINAATASGRFALNPKRGYSRRGPRTSLQDRTMQACTRAGALGGIAGRMAERMAGGWKPFRAH
ncbi:hypothetical protein AOQ84DRAFT_380809 [Glonium stellatum]|uniref:Uncharacterized protein n=1 Tax=Glonium stellatum TaxID=574774 RepID=A0A8E2JP51_9PEZI|nr:hypothetical protein AOQ84DRAFT_380809 [Glonium stellatum]